MKIKLELEKRQMEILILGMETCRDAMARRKEEVAKELKEMVKMLKQVYWEQVNHDVP